MRTTFQKNPDQLKRQQQILTSLGFYHGKIDGIWGPASIAAMVKFEAHPSFVPGIPNHGMPLSEGVALPAGIYKDTEVKRSLPSLFTMSNLTAPASGVPTPIDVAKPVTPTTPPALAAEVAAKTVEVKPEVKQAK